MFPEKPFLLISKGRNVKMVKKEEAKERAK
jgi:hypothetical protein